MKKLTLCLILLTAVQSHTPAQVWRAGTPQALPTYSRQGTGVPTGNCTTGQRYFQEDATAGANWWDCTSTNVWTKSGGRESSYVHSTFKSPAGATGIFHAFGYYTAPSSAVALDQASTTQTMGSADNAYGARAFSVASAAGTASGGTNGVPVLTVTGTSFNPATGVRAAGDSEVLVADCTTDALNTYHETVKYWIGQITYTLSKTGDRTNWAFTFNYGLGVPLYFNSQNVTVSRVTTTGRSGGNDGGFNLQVLKHTPTGVGWAYSAKAFVPGGTVLWDMNTDYNTEKNLVNGQRFRWTRSGLSTVINGASGEGLVIRITTTANNAVESSDYRIYYVIN